MLALANIVHVPHHGSATLRSSNWIRVHRKRNSLSREIHWRFVHECTLDQGRDISKTSTDRCTSRDLIEFLQFSAQNQTLHLCMFPSDLALLQADLEHNSVTIH